MTMTRATNFPLLLIQLIVLLSTSSARPQSSPNDITRPSLEDPCHPTPPPSQDVYIVGYGSLLNTTSKSKTDPTTGTNIPVRVKGFARKWNCKGSSVGFSTTYLGVDEDPTKSATFNGVVFKLRSVESLAQYDRRERFYCRKKVNISDIEFLIGKDFNEDVRTDFPSENAQFWVYDVQKEYIAFPSERYPIVQSYVDVFLGGCFEMELTYNISGYADECMATTEGWKYPWVNDRLVPRRPFVHTPRSFQIDYLIQKYLPGHFDNAIVEHEIRHYYKNSSQQRGYSGGNFGVMVLGFLVVTITKVLMGFY